MKATKHIDCEHCESRYKSIFCDLKGEHLASINEHKGCNMYKKGQTIFSEGFFPQGLFCINAGKVKVAQVGDNGREQIITINKRWRYFRLPCLVEWREIFCFCGGS
jgi:CRP-like cAMP-binding protein